MPRENRHHIVRQIRYIRFFITAFMFIIVADPMLVHAIEPVPETKQLSELTQLPSDNTRLSEQPAEENSEPELVEEVINGVEGVIHGVEEALDYQHQTLSEKIVDFTDKIDTFFINNDQEQRMNYTHMQLGYRYTGYENKPSQLEPVFDARIHLPRTENYLSLEVSNLNAFDSSNEAATGGTAKPGQQNQTAQALNVGLGYARDISEFFSAKVTGGVRNEGSTVSLFANLRLKREFFFDKWSLNLSEDLYHDGIIHSRATSQMLFERKVSEERLFRSITQNIYYYDLGYTQNHQIFSLLHQLGKRSAIISEVGAMWERPLEILDYKLENSYILVRYSQMIYKDWLFLEAAPQINFLRSESFRPEPQFMLQLTAFIGNMS